MLPTRTMFIHARRLATLDRCMYSKLSCARSRAAASYGRPWPPPTRPRSSPAPWSPPCAFNTTPPQTIFPAHPTVRRRPRLRIPHLLRRRACRPSLRALPLPSAWKVERRPLALQLAGRSIVGLGRRPLVVEAAQVGTPIVLLEEAPPHLPLNDSCREHDLVLEREGKCVCV